MNRDKWCGSLSGKQLGDVVLGSAHTLQGIIYLILALVYRLTDGYVLSTIPLHITVPTGRPGSVNTTYEIVDSFEASPLWLIIAFFFVTGMFHFIRSDVCGCCKMSSKSGKLAEEMRLWDRKVRWIEYSITSTLMIYTILLLSGVSDLYALAGAGGANLAMILFGYAGDLTDPMSGNDRMTTFIFGSVVGLAPWVVIFTQISVMSTLGYAPGALVFAITIGLFFWFFTFAINEARYIYSFPSKNSGKVGSSNRGDWKMDAKKTEYVRDAVEWWYQILSAVAKTLLGALTAAAVLTTE